MLIMSWNVAGLSTTVHRIQEHYGNHHHSNTATTTDGTTKRKKQQQPQQNDNISTKVKSNHALIHFFQQHMADIICMQEHKISYRQLQNRNEPYQCALGRSNYPKDKNDDSLYESYWSCCVDPKYKGLNGVVTYVKRNSGSSRVVSANGTSPLQDAELDQQGRCVITEHGPSSAGFTSDNSAAVVPGFILFNVYVPCSGGSHHSIQRKMKFLRALRRTMQEQRLRKQKPIILVGDLNISYSKDDIHWKDRVIYINDIVAEVQQQQQEPTAKTNDVSIPQWKIDIVTYWPTIVQTLNDRQMVVPTRTTNSKTGEVYNKFRLCVTVVDPTKNCDGDTNDDTTHTSTRTDGSSCDRSRIFLGHHESSKEDCWHCYNFTEKSYYDEMLEQTIITQEDNMVGVSILLELMNKIIFLPQQLPCWDETILYEIATTVGTINRTSPARLWLQSLVRDDQMIDTFRYYYPMVTHRFTCWNQNKNHRYSNYGTRIDYTLIDSSLLPYLQKGDVATLRCPTISTTTNVDHEATVCSDELSALQAVTANGRYQPASYEGGGIMEASRDVLDTQFGIPHTGHIYTPPTYSDHVAVSLLLHDTVLLSEGAAMNDNDDTSVTIASTMNANDANTRKAQPHKQQPTIGSFFQNATKISTITNIDTNNSNDSLSSYTKKVTKRNHPKAVPPPNSVWYHFNKKEKLSRPPSPSK
jgi:exonuclease III